MLILFSVEGPSTTWISRNRLFSSGSVEYSDSRSMEGGLSRRRRQAIRHSSRWHEYKATPHSRTLQQFYTHHTELWIG